MTLPDGPPAEGVVPEDAFYRALARNFPNGWVLFFDQRLCILHADGVGVAALGLAPDALGGALMHEALPAELAAALADPCRAALAGAPATLAVTCATREYEVQIVPVRDARGTPRAGVIMARDITVRRRVQRELAEARDAAVQATQAKSDFLASVSHEIRTPLDAILGLATLLQDTPLSAKQGDYVQTIANSGNALLTLINDLLDMAKIESGKLVLDNGPFALRETIGEALAMLMPAAQRKGLTLQTLIADDVPPVVVGDASRVRQVLINLVGNAVKFTERGAVQVEAAVQTARADGWMLAVAVSDTGIGIAPEQFDRLFQAYSQLEAGGAAYRGGTGLGLAISRRLVELMGGTISVESTLGAGATFSFTLNVARPAATEQAHTPTIFRFDEGLAARLPLRILVAEDNPVNRQIVLGFLERMGYAADAVENGRAAFEALAHAPYDLVLLDMHMPELNGLETAQRILAERPGDQRPALIAMTASAMPAERARGLAAGVDDYLTKPLHPANLQTALERWGAWATGRAQATGPGAGVIDWAMLQFAQMDERGRALLQLVSQTFLSTVPERLAGVRAAIAAGQAQETREQAHSLKGACGGLGVQQMVALCQQIENLAVATPFDTAQAQTVMVALDQEFARAAEVLREWAAPASEEGSG